MPLVLVNSPPDLVIPFPLAMGASWSNNFSQGEGTVENEETAEVDGWGTLITPAGREACLRVHKTRQITFADSDLNLTVTFEQYLFVTQGRTGAIIGLDPAATPKFSAVYTVSDKGEVGEGLSTAYEELSWGAVKGLVK